MEKLDIKQINKKGKLPKILKGLPEDLKNPERYSEIEQKIRFIMVADHKHRGVGTFVNCKRCIAKMDKRRNYLNELGFKNYGQYLEWRKIMDIITNQKDIQLR